MSGSVLVTGASGFLGRHVVRALVERGHEVHALSRDDRVPEPGVTWHVVDVMDRKATDHIVGQVRPSHMVHAAWHTEPANYADSMDNLRWVEASLGILSSFLDHGGRRSVFVGSCFEYEWRDGALPESTPRRPSTVYGACKAALGELIEGMARLRRLDAAWARPFFLYGPHEDPRRLASSIVISVLRGERARMSHGRQRRDYMFVGDVGDALAALLDSKVTGAVNIGTGEAVTLLDLARSLARQAGNEDLLAVGTIDPRPGEPDEIIADVSRLRHEVGWQPRYGDEVGIARTVDYWRSELGLG
jgi:nucleoside-diphosphate-sugar epimerase